MSRNGEGGRGFEPPSSINVLHTQLHTWTATWANRLAGRQSSDPCQVRQSLLNQEISIVLLSSTSPSFSTRAPLRKLFSHSQQEGEGAVGAARRQKHLHVI